MTQDGYTLSPSKYAKDFMICTATGGLVVISLLNWNMIYWIYCQLEIGTGGPVACGHEILRTELFELPGKTLDNGMLLRW